ncbi:MAG: electron transporter RnfG [Spirochaetes bacterium GWB1_48_6]|nr:MAG: electron transporter RnfG [Spirochaetes bacterium GWB1_48_6]
MKKDILRLGTSLALYAVAACVALALVYSITAPTIAGLAQQQLEASLTDLFPDAESFEAVKDALPSVDTAVAFEGAWTAKRGANILGVAIKANGKSYGGAAVMLVGISTDKRISGARILTLSDTPGLGANALSPTYFVDKSSKTTFPGQFSGKPVSDPFEVKNDVTAITASTITSKALTLMVKRSGEAGSAWLEANAAGGVK